MNHTLSSNQVELESPNMEVLAVLSLKVGFGPVVYQSGMQIQDLVRDYTSKHYTDECKRMSNDFIFIIFLYVQHITFSQNEETSCFVIDS